jgi:hypothetical protein
MKQTVEWILVKDRLPNMGEQVILCTDQDVRFQAWINQNQLWCNMDNEPFHTNAQKQIIAWMPFP